MIKKEFSFSSLTQFLSTSSHIWSSIILEKTTLKNPTFSNDCFPVSGIRSIHWTILLFHPLIPLRLLTASFCSTTKKSCRTLRRWREARRGGSPTSIRGAWGEGVFDKDYPAVEKWIQTISNRPATIAGFKGREGGHVREGFKWGENATES